VGEWRKTLTSTPYLVLFIILISISVGTASALITITLAGNVLVTGTLTAEEYFDNGNIQTGIDATALGGLGNNASGIASTVGGGFSNTASGNQATIGGGAINQATEALSTVSGGDSNQATGNRATVSGGNFNLATGHFSAVPGGTANEAGGQWSFAAGRNAKAIHDGSMVFADSTNADFSSTAPDQFSIRAAGGVRMVGDLAVEGEVHCPTCILGFYHKTFDFDVEGSTQIGGGFECDVGDTPIGGSFEEFISGQSVRLIESTLAPDGEGWDTSVKWDSNAGVGDFVRFGVMCADHLPVHVP